MTKPTKADAARALGLSMYRLECIIAAGQLPKNPDAADVARFKEKNDRAMKRYRGEVLAAYDAGRSVKYCACILQTATDKRKLWLPKHVRPRDCAERMIYEHQKGVNTHGTE